MNGVVEFALISRLHTMILILMVFPLQAVIHGQQQSSWVQAFQKARGGRELNIVNTYLEDEKQLDEVYWYLNELYTTSTSGLGELKFIDLASFILDVLLPEVNFCCKTLQFEKRVLL